MKKWLLRLRYLVVLGVLLPSTLLAQTESYKNATQARAQGNYMMIQFADGHKSMVPLSSLSLEDRQFLDNLSQVHPLPQGNSRVTVVKETTTAKRKQTIVTSQKEGPLETVQLCPPNIFRDQIGATCMLYARVHLLDIAGYYVQNGDIYKIINGTRPDSPWENPAYINGLVSIYTRQTPQPLVHYPPTGVNIFEWTRQELRKGRPVLGAFPREIWQALPPGFIATHPWNGGKVGHQIVVNGFTYNRQTGEGTFHIINSWSELPEFDLKLSSAKDGNLVIEQSVSPLGESVESTGNSTETVISVTRLKAAGSSGLYEVKTTKGTRRIIAASEEAARAMIEEGR